MLKSGEGRPVPFSTILASHGRASVDGGPLVASWSWQCGSGGGGRGAVNPCAAQHSMLVFFLPCSLALFLILALIYFLLFIYNFLVSLFSISRFFLSFCFCSQFRFSRPFFRSLSLCLRLHLSVFFYLSIYLFLLSVFYISLFFSVFSVFFAVPFFPAFFSFLSLCLRLFYRFAFPH